MNTEQEIKTLNLLEKDLSGELFTGMTQRLLYATDASAYREIPMAVALPATIGDIQLLIRFAAENNTTLIPRTAGTSLAGQVVGNGIVVDVSRHFTRILEINEAEGFVRLQPGVVLDELNMKLAAKGLFFGPETSTSNRCMIGGMVGNNACGAHSLIYGSTRDHLLAVDTLLSDGQPVVFGSLGKDAFIAKLQGNGLENTIYRNIHEILSLPENRMQIMNGFPDPAIKRRNTGYALDLLLHTEPFTPNGFPFNFSKLIAGSEGTLAFITEIKLNLVPLPPREKGLICIHFNTLEESLLANLICLKYNPGAVELMDQTILECTKSNISQRKNRFFVQGDPGAILIVEFARHSMSEIHEIRNALERELRQAGLGHHFPLITGDDINKVWALRKSGLGVLSNIPGDAKPVSLVEDTAVRPDMLPDYIRDIKVILDSYKLNCVFHAHVGTGELHMRPVLNLKDPKGIELFRKVATDVAWLVKKYRGSLSGEHGDGRLRGEFIPVIVGEKNYELMRQVKRTWDPQGIFNKGKITDTPKMDSSLRTRITRGNVEIKPVFDHAATMGFLRHVEQCNGSGDCRKSELMGGTMCPSYMATRDEQTTTRARANALREYLIRPADTKALSIDAVYDILDLCLSCKGCKSECPSNVDMAMLKAEFLQHYHDIKGVSLTTWLVANIAVIHRINSRFPVVFNTLLKSRFISGFVKKLLGFAGEREIPLLSPRSFEKWLRQNNYFKPVNSAQPGDKREVYLFVDEFTNYLEAEIGITAVKLLTKLGYGIRVVTSRESARTYISKGLLRKARKIADKNIRLFSPLVNENHLLVGLEPSAILTFRDEYPGLASERLRNTARNLAQYCLTIDEFIAAEFQAGRIDRKSFTDGRQNIRFHGHCQQKAVASTEHTKIMLTIPENYSVDEIKSGCCGMAGAFGYEKRHYELSMKVGELVLFPAVRDAVPGTLICASGTSCRQQILDGTGVQALHPVEILYKALKNSRE
ncbi:MAG TPA: FAD-linked oxidase C-terminal domain-containing protein [Bacteroidales bacterium]|nr:FAD-linked oxidase C-terminal domain-containing protein [Bacteroidales bacterium]